MQKKAVILINLGSPDSTSIPDVRKYLAEFLWDKRVISINPIARWLLLHGIILRTRPKHSAENYKKIWTPDGSPLVVISKELREKVAREVSIPVYLAMRYGSPSIRSVLINLRAEGITDALIIPLYPQYAMSSYETVVEKVHEEARRLELNTHFSFLPPFYNDPEYIQALVESADPYLKKDYDHLLFSFHGIPVSHLQKSVNDPRHGLGILQTEDCCAPNAESRKTCYRHQCYETVKYFTEVANISKDAYSFSFQSRLGKEPWLQPYTIDKFHELPKQGIKKLLVICPVFVSDCLETLEEISGEGKEIFINAGGQSFEQIPCLNTHPSWISFLKKKIKNYIET